MSEDDRPVERSGDEFAQQFRRCSSLESDAVALDESTHAAVHAELAVVRIDLLRWSDVLRGDLIGVAHDELIASAQRYPAGAVRSSVQKRP